MNDPIIDRIDALEHFHTLLDPARSERFLRLLGEAKMGKSHLLTKVFPKLAVARGMECVVVDLRSRQITIIEHLHHIRSQLGRDRFERFDAAYHEWINKPQIEAKNLQAVLSLVSMRSRSEEDDSARMIPHFTSCFADDLHADCDRPLLLVFDAVEQADDVTQAWLMDKLLVQLHHSDHVHVVVGGRKIPDPAGSYHPICRSFELKPVKHDEEYIRYCRAVGATMVEQSICDFAKALNYSPGAFADTIACFVPGGQP